MRTGLNWFMLKYKICFGIIGDEFPWSVKSFEILQIYIAGICSSPIHPVY